MSAHGSARFVLRERGALTIAEIIRSYSEGSARSVGRSDLGQLSVSFAAELVDFDQNPLEVDSKNLGDIKILQVWVAGRRVR